MQLPRALARSNRAVLNKAVRPLAGWVPGLAVVIHHGRVSGRRYETPVMVFPVHHDLRIALTYGAHADWVSNVLAAGGCVVRARGRETAYPRAAVTHDLERRGVRPVERWVLARLRVADFLDLSRE